MHLSPEEKAIGKQNFHAAIGSELTRRDFLKGSIAAGVVSGAGLGGYYFGYQKVHDPVRVGVIGTGDEGSVLIGAHTPDYLRIVAISDIRPYNIHRAFHGDEASPNALKVRPGLMSKYGWKTEDEARKHVKVYTNYKELLADDEIEGVVIALPLHLHAPVAIEAMRAGKHVLTEKLMAHSVAQCKEMARVAQQTGLHLATGHQRHYSILYDNAVETIRSGLLGDLHHIRAQWHRGNLPGRDSWQPPLPAEVEQALGELCKKRDGCDPSDRKRAEDLDRLIRVARAQVLDKDVEAAKYGYQEYKLLDHRGEVVYTCSPLEELIRWRLWNRTGGGLMAELGSHQLDAASIFISAMYDDVEAPGGGKEKFKVEPLTVSAAGGRHLFPADRDVEDHVYCIYEFPAPGYYADLKSRQVADPNKKIVVTYSSINGNGFGHYGEIVMGTKGTLILEGEQEVMLFKDSSTTTHVKVSKKGSSGPALDTTDSGGGAAVEAGKQGLDRGPVSRGYTEEMEHWAFCIRNPDPAHRPKCHPKVALGDAVIALTTNIAIREQKKIDFQPEWFEIDRDETPEGDKPHVSRYKA